MMTSDDIRRLRNERGLTQAELASLVGCSQPTISLIEKDPSYSVSGALLNAIEDILTQKHIPNTNDVSYQDIEVWEDSNHEIPRMLRIKSLPINLEEYKRPRRSGDFVFNYPISPKEVIIIATDLVGHGKEMFKQTLYLNGLLEGYLSVMPQMIDLIGMAEKFAEVLRGIDLGAAVFFARFVKHSELPHTVIYEGVSYGFPIPLLITGMTRRTIPSAELHPPLPEGIGVTPLVTRHTLSAPWRLVMSSDGMLSRLGNGDEKSGRKQILNSLIGVNRDEPLDKLFYDPRIPYDDEIIAQATWVSWDRQMSFPYKDEYNFIFFKDVIKQKEFGKQNLNDYHDLATALAEAYHNIGDHAYPNGNGLVTLRYRKEPHGVRIEVEDRGRKEISQESLDRHYHGFALMKSCVDSVSVRKARNGGSIVELFKRIGREEDAN